MRAPPTRSGLLFGIVLVASIFNAAFGLPALLTWMLAKSGRLALRRTDIPIVVVLLGKIAWLTVIHAIFKPQQSAFSLLQSLSVDFVLLAAFCVRKDDDFFEGLGRPLVALFMVDLLFNASSLVLGADPLGRVLGSRPDDVIPRLGGLFYHPFVSINISLMAILFSILRHQRFIGFLAVANIVMNGSFRGWVSLAVGVLVIALLRLRLGRLKFVIVCLLAAASVFVATIYSVRISEELTGNALRVYAWVTALAKIETSPWLGNHEFETGEYFSMSEDIIADWGIAESTYLGYGMHYGILPMLAHLVILLWVLLRCLRQVRINPGMIQWLAALFAGVVFVDTFYGTLLGSVLTTTCFGLLCISYRESAWLTASAATPASPRPNP